MAALAAFYFVGFYFATAALFPAYALASGLIGAAFAMGVYLALFFLRQDEPGIPLALLILFPVICLTAGVLWWLLRLLGLWPPR